MSASCRLQYSMASNCQNVEVVVTCLRLQARSSMTKHFIASFLDEGLNCYVIQNTKLIRV